MVAVLSRSLDCTRSVCFVFVSFLSCYFSLSFVNGVVFVFCCVLFFFFLIKLQIELPYRSFLQCIVSKKGHVIKKLFLS